MKCSARALSKLTSLIAKPRSVTCLTATARNPSISLYPLPIHHPNNLKFQAGKCLVFSDSATTSASVQTLPKRIFWIFWIYCSSNSGPTYIFPDPFDLIMRNLEVTKKLFLLFGSVRTIGNGIHPENKYIPVSHLGKWHVIWCSASYSGIYQYCNQLCGRVPT